MARRKRSFKTFPKRATLWLPFDANLQLVTAGTVVVSANLLGNYFTQTGEQVPIGTTLGPIRGEVVLTPVIATVFSTDWTVEALVQLLPEGGRAVSPIPGVDIVDAMWYGQMAANALVTETAAGVFSQLATTRPFESKAMRKVTGNAQQLLLFGASNDNTDYQYRVFGHIMLKLP